MQTNEDVKQLRENRQAMGAHSSGGIQMAPQDDGNVPVSLLFKDISKVKIFQFYIACKK